MTTRKYNYRINKFQSKITFYNENHFFNYESIRSVVTYDLQSKFNVLIIVNTTLYLLSTRNIVRNVTRTITKNYIELII